MLMIDLLGSIFSTIQTNKKTLAALTVVLVIYVALLVTDITDYFSFVKVLLFLPYCLNILKIIPNTPSDLINLS
jgi:hypothetical protein